MVSAHAIRTKPRSAPHAEVSFDNDSRVYAVELHSADKKERHVMPVEIRGQPIEFENVGDTMHDGKVFQMTVRRQKEELLDQFDSMTPGENEALLYFELTVRDAISVGVLVKVLDVKAMRSMIPQTSTSVDRT